VVLVGEIRDAETATIAIQAALTGHLVLSSSMPMMPPGVIFRLLDLGIEPFLVSSALAGVVAQRMVRRLCPECGRPVKVSLLEQMIYTKETEDERTAFMYGSGCATCSKTGYLGRIGIFEILHMSEELKMMVLKGASAADMKAQANRDGVISLLRDGMLKVMTNQTTPSEVLRNAYTME
jgi:general secretion pathway protein E